MSIMGTGRLISCSLSLCKWPPKQSWVAVTLSVSGLLPHLRFDVHLVPKFTQACDLGTLGQTINSGIEAHLLTEWPDKSKYCFVRIRVSLLFQLLFGHAKRHFLRALKFWL